MDTVILASGSPRRRELLTKVRIPFKVVPPEVSEDHDGTLPVPALVAALARRKVEAVLALFRAQSPRWVLGLDTIVEIDGAALGKPGSPEEAEAMLRRLSGRVHRVFTGVVLLVERSRPLVEQVACTEVMVRALTPEEIRFWVDSGEWNGAAGGYRIQERGAFFIEWIRGSYSNVVGLPLETIYGMLTRNGYCF